MAWRIDKQPNGKYARFSEVVDNFTHINMSEKEAFNVCLEGGCNQRQAKGKLRRANKFNHRFEEDLRILRQVHGDEQAENVLILTTKQTKQWQENTN